jgi:hypothetical protein
MTSMTTVEFDPNRPSRSQLAPPQIVEPAWQRLWFSILQSAWSSLTIVPSDPGIDTLRIAESLAAAGRQHAARTIQVVNGVGVAVNAFESLMASVAAATDRGETVLVPVDAIDVNPSVAPLIRTCHAVLLAVRIGESRVSSAKAVVEAAGGTRVIGSVVIG